MFGQIDDAIVVVQEVKQFHDNTQQHNSTSHKNETSTNVDNHIAQSGESFLLTKSNDLLDQHEKAKDGKDLGETAN